MPLNTLALTDAALQPPHVEFHIYVIACGDGLAHARLHVSESFGGTYRHVGGSAVQVGDQGGLVSILICAFPKIRGRFLGSS